jgi:CheY-like chemotaxis protein
VSELEPRRLRVLIVEDHEDLGEALAETVRHLGHDATVARDGPEALARWPAPRAPEVALIDLGLPRLDGYEVARRVSLEGTSALLVAITGSIAPEVPRRCREAGFALHLLKPVRLAQLERLLGEVARRRPWARPAQFSAAASSISTSRSRAPSGSEASSSTATLSSTAWA